MERNSLLSFFRFSVWWHHLLSPLLPVFYLMLMLSTQWGTVAYHLLLFLCSFVFTASFGYALNDCFDRGMDKKAGKPNSLSGWNTLGITFLLLVLFLMGIMPWYGLGIRGWPFHLWLVLVLCLLLYSLPFFRWKEKSFLGVILDVGYGHVLPLSICILLFFPLMKPELLHHEWLLFFVICLYLFKGGRNIILHQIDDRKTDMENESNTFVLNVGPRNMLPILNYYLIPIELVLMIGLHLILAKTLWFVPLFLFLFLSMTILKFSAWKLFTTPKRQWKFKFWYFLNDYYEFYAPLFFILILVMIKTEWYYFLLIHIVLFPRIFPKLKEDIQVIIKNIRDVWDSRTT